MKNTLKLKLLLLSLSSNNIFSINGLREIKQLSRGGNFIQITDKKIIVPDFDLGYFVASVASDGILSQFVVKNEKAYQISFDGYDSGKMHKNIVSSFLSENEQYNSETHKNYLYTLLKNTNIAQDTFDTNKFVEWFRGENIDFLKFAKQQQIIGSSNTTAGDTTGDTTNDTTNDNIGSTALAGDKKVRKQEQSSVGSQEQSVRNQEQSSVGSQEQSSVESQEQSVDDLLGIGAVSCSNSPSNSYKEKDWKLIGGIAILIIILAAVFLYFLKNNRSKSSVVLNKFSKS